MLKIAFLLGISFQSSLVLTIVGMYAFHIFTVSRVVILYLRHLPQSSFRIGSVQSMINVKKRGRLVKKMEIFCYDWVCAVDTICAKTF